MKTKNTVISLVIVIFILTLVIFAGCKKEQPAAGAAAQIEQKMCPVMTDMPINPDVFTEYKGKKVYFCCTDCKAKFEADPEKYVSNLPQFKN